MKKTFQKTLLYNLVLFNFILLEASTKKICNFFIEKYINTLSKKIYFKMSTTGLLLSFKRLFRSLYFHKRINKKSLLAFFANEHLIEVLKFVFKQQTINCFVSFNPLTMIKSSSLLKSLYFLEHPLTFSKILACFFQKNFFLHAVNPFEDNLHFTVFKIFSNFDDQKKLIFFSLIFASIFKR